MFIDLCVPPDFLQFVTEELSQSKTALSCFERFVFSRSEFICLLFRFCEINESINFMGYDLSTLNDSRLFVCGS